ncbi:hypothetical protein [Microtetraspora sp. NBRC 16547]|uniref:hypothetical protein n=1 Tax=Microtetraspora sp. NBRC 16547 TaxID=3030993 RepID=UPI0024A36417|nr:hypothetical protein [Microtetraspora sp. NBRC 16547]GLW96652.1 hypothetical protein Misp02_07390 [Microtetraspora sp. NBRC 16547]
MELAALAVWILTALAGLYLLVLWLAGSGLRQQATKVTAFPTALILTHPALAVAGLGLWVGFLLTHESGYAWGAFAVLTAVALLGFTLSTRWLGGVGRHARGTERRFPMIAVALHGVAGISTFVLVLLTASMVQRF